MARFNVELTRTMVQCVEVEAEDEAEAIARAFEQTAYSWMDDSEVVNEDAEVVE